MTGDNETDRFFASGFVPRGDITKEEGLIEQYVQSSDTSLTQASHRLPKSSYYDPVFTTIHLEIIWSVRVIHSRFYRATIRLLLKLLLPQRPVWRTFKEGFSNRGGYEAETIFFDYREERDSMSYPDY